MKQVSQKVSKRSGFFRCAIVTALALTVADAAEPVQNITGTLHDLRPRTTVVADVNNEVCVFCHTPHGANDAYYGDDTPLWNKGAPLTQDYTLYGKTIGGTEVTSLGGSSKICLSCHDGVSGMNSIRNLPGSGGYYPDGQGKYIKMNEITSQFPMPSESYQIGKNRWTGADGDLSDDHPISVTYRGDEDNPPANLVPTDTALVDWAGATTISDLLRNGKVECVSCHNPHTKGNQSFLRVQNNVGSNLCFGCHAK